MQNLTQHVSYSGFMLHLGESTQINPACKARKKIGGRMHEQWRKSITTLIFVLCLPVALTASAQAPKAALAFKPDAPERYIVVPGDTLWSIAQRYTDSPWRWSELWNMNKDALKSPHRIYPGNVIVLDRSKNQLAIDASQQTVKLSPSVRTEAISQEIPAIPSGAIEPFLVRPLIIEPDGLDKAPSIVGIEDNRVIVGAGNTVYARGLGDSKVTTWFLYRRGNPLVDPETNRTLGYEAVQIGTAEVTRAGDPAALRLVNVLQEVVVGDKLVAAGKPEVVSYAPRPAAATLNGRVISIYGAVGRSAEAGSLSIITINRGKADGVDIGTVVGLYGAASPVIDTSRPRGSPDALIKTPEDRYGVAFVFRTFDKLSYALVMRITRPVRASDAVRNP